MNKFSPEFNILKVAGYSLGFKHSEATKELMSQLAKGRKISPETLIKMKSRVVSDVARAKISTALKGREVSEETRDLKRKALLGGKHSKETVEKMTLSNTFRQPILLTNMETGETQEFTSMTEAGKYLGVSRVVISHYLKKNTPYKGYQFYK